MSKDKSVAQMQREILTKISFRATPLSLGGTLAFGFRDVYFAQEYDGHDPVRYWEAETLEGLIEKIYNEVVTQCKP